MQNAPTPSSTNESTATESQPKVKKRHGCLTTWLLFIILANVGLTIYIIVLVSRSPHDYYAWVLPVQIIFGVWSVICTILIFMWKKWGFYGFLVGAVGSMIANIITGNYFYAFTPFVSVLALFGVLNIGGKKRGWPQME